MNINNIEEMTMAKISDNTEVALPLRNILSMIAGASVATWAYFGIVERLNQIETQQHMQQNDVTMNTEFRIKWPRGEMGSLPADSEQFMLIEHIAGELEKLTTEIETGQAPFDQQQKLTMEFYEKRINQLEEAIEKIKDSQLELKNGH
jgi:exonuclease VII small subunit